MNDKQKLFDTATAAIIAQGRASKEPRSNTVGARTVCLYRAADGAKCAVGHILTDAQMEKYHVGNAHSVWNFESALMMELLPQSAEADTHRAKEFLANLQDAHDMADESKFVEDFIARANKCALKWNLSPIGTKV